MATVVARASRDGSRRSHVLAVFSLVGAAVVAGAMQAAVLQMLGSLVGLQGRLAGVAVVLPLGVVGSALIRRHPWQFDAETPRGWLRYPGVVAPILNGVVLGSGVFTRIGFWLFYILLVLAVISPSASWAALYGAIYGMSRTAIPLLVRSRSRIAPDVAAPVLTLRQGAQAIDRAGACFLGLGIGILVGQALIV